VASYSVLIKPSAAKELQAVGQRKDRARLVERIRSLGVEPRSRGCERLAGTEDVYRVRVGSYRILYSVDDKSAAVHVIKVGHRSDVYR
jgi:mRNA interferase RelE/StbE